MTKLAPHPMNAKGDFYVENQCCTGCDLPSAEAPEMFKYEGDHCYVCRQPETKEEVVKILNAMEIQDLDCIQYKGKNKAILASLKQRNLESCISSNLQVALAKFKESIGFR